MENIKLVGMEEMIAALSGRVGQKFPVKITTKNGGVMVRYVRGFADQQKHILLISENATSLALKIMEIKDIQTLEFGVENSGAEWIKMRADWHAQRG